jgi:hypothetical protein
VTSMSAAMGLPGKEPGTLVTIVKRVPTAIRVPGQVMLGLVFLPSGRPRAFSVERSSEPHPPRTGDQADAHEHE